MDLNLSFITIVRLRPKIGYKKKHQEIIETVYVKQ